MCPEPVVFIRDPTGSGPGPIFLLWPFGCHLGGDALLPILTTYNPPYRRTWHTPRGPPISACPVSLAFSPQKVCYQFAKFPAVFAPRRAPSFPPEPPQNGSMDVTLASLSGN